MKAAVSIDLIVLETPPFVDQMSTDQSTLDLDLYTNFTTSTRGFLELSAILMVTATITPQMLISAAPCVVGVIWLQVGEMEVYT